MQRRRNLVRLDPEAAGDGRELRARARRDWLQRALPAEPARAAESADGGWGYHVQPADPACGACAEGWSALTAEIKKKRGGRSRGCLYRRKVIFRPLPVRLTQRQETSNLGVFLYDDFPLLACMILQHNVHTVYSRHDILIWQVAGTERSEVVSCGDWTMPPFVES